MIRFTFKCPMRVEDMPRVAGGWQCTAGCGKTVVDLSAMTEADAVDLVQRERVCGRLLFDNLGKPIFAAAAGAALVTGLTRREVDAGVVSPFASLASGHEERLVGELAPSVQNPPPRRNLPPHAQAPRVIPEVHDGPVPSPPDPIEIRSVTGALSLDYDVVGRVKAD